MLRIPTPSRRLCAASIRSNGSRCVPGSNPAFSACAGVISSSMNPSLSIRRDQSWAIRPPDGSFPIRYFVAISHEDAALTNTRFDGSRISACTRGESLSGCAHHHSSACVSTRKVTSPTRQSHFPEADQKMNPVRPRRNDQAHALEAQQVAQGERRVSRLSRV